MRFRRIRLGGSGTTTQREREPGEKSREQIKHGADEQDPVGEMPGEIYEKSQQNNDLKTLPRAKIDPLGTPEAPRAHHEKANGYHECNPDCRQPPCGNRLTVKEVDD